METAFLSARKNRLYVRHVGREDGRWLTWHTYGCIRGRGRGSEKLKGSGRQQPSEENHWHLPHFKDFNCVLPRCRKSCVERVRNIGDGLDMARNGNSIILNAVGTVTNPKMLVETESTGTVISRKSMLFCHFQSLSKAKQNPKTEFQSGWRHLVRLIVDFARLLHLVPFDKWSAPE